MPRHEHLVLCGGVQPTSDASGAGAHVLRLSLNGPAANVTLRIQDISSRLATNIPDELVDLLEVASYVYAADSAISRGGKADAHMGARWRRKLRFVIPVRRPDLWGSAPVSLGLSETLGFLSEDDYAFEFKQLAERPAMQGYLEFSGEDVEAFAPDEVILFSGGLDSFAGAVEALVAQGKSVALVSHRSASKIESAQKHLVAQLRTRIGAARALHVPVLVRLDGSLGQEEPTHRTRSFLFAALGAVTARLFGLGRIAFFENGVVSLNLPPVGQVVGARATRTTHPQALAGFRRVLAALLGRPFEVANPFMWLTKAEVVGRIAANGFADLIRHTRSCARVYEMTIMHPHCGHCSQCIDRRFAILAAGVARDDPEEAYKVALFTGERRAGPDREMALAYVRSATAIRRMSDVAFFEHYGEASRAVGFFAEPSDVVAERILDLHRRHAAAVCSSFERAIAAHAGALAEGSLPPSCLLLLAVSRSELPVGATYTPHHGQRQEAEQGPASRALGPEAVSSRREIRMAVGGSGERVVFDRWGELTGSSARLLAILARPFEQAVIEKRAPERFPFTQSSKLVSDLGVGSDETLRCRVARCREQIALLATSAGDAPPSVDAVIENLQWHGYRLNPDRIRIVAITELTEPERVTPSGQRVTSR